MSKYKIGDIVLCRRYNNFIGNLFTGEIVKVTKLKRIEYGPFKLNELKPGEIHSATKSEIYNYLNNTAI